MMGAMMLFLVTENCRFRSAHARDVTAYIMRAIKELADRIQNPSKYALIQAIVEKSPCI